MRLPKFSIPLFGLCTLTAMVAFGQSREKGLLAWADVYRFPESDSSCVVEVDYAIERGSLVYRDQGPFRIASARIECEIYRDQDVVHRSQIEVQDTMSAVAQVRGGQKLLEMRRYRFRPGRYVLAISFHDEVAGVSRSVSDTLEVTGRKKSALDGSDLILASFLRPSSESSSAYWRNGLEVVPNASRVFGRGLEDLHFYAEVYGLAQAADGSGCYSMDVAVRDAAGRTPIQYIGSAHRVKGKACAVHGSVSLRDLDAGVYQMEVRVHDCVSGDSLHLSRPFFVVRPALASSTPGRPDLAEGAVASEYAQMTERQLDSLFALSEYVATGEERAVYPRLDLEGKRNFLVQFWKRRDPNPATPENEARRDYFQRIGYANQHFSFGRRQGWRTDRGRVLLQYGWPDHVDRLVGEMIENPYEIWTYEKLQGGILFVFVDRRRTGEYELVHSTALGEIKDEHWSDYLYR